MYELSDFSKKKVMVLDTPPKPYQYTTYFIIEDGNRVEITPENLMDLWEKYTNLLMEKIKADPLSLLLMEIEEKIKEQMEKEKDEKIALPENFDGVMFRNTPIPREKIPVTLRDICKSSLGIPTDQEFERDEYMKACDYHHEARNKFRLHLIKELGDHYGFSDTESELIFDVSADKAGRDSYKKIIPAYDKLATTQDIIKTLGDDILGDIFEGEDKEFKEDDGENQDS